MNDVNLLPSAQLCVNGILLWIGFGTVVGFVVRGLLPGKEPSGPLGTLLIGMAGSATGPLLFSLIPGVRSETFNPISPFGFLAALAASSLILLGFRMLLKLREHRSE